jgi:hypothetical protein
LKPRIPAQRLDSAATVIIGSELEPLLFPAPTFAPPKSGKAQLKFIISKTAEAKKSTAFV